MIKKIICFLVVTSLFVLTSCQAAPAPEDSYATEMQPVLELLDTWHGHVSSLESLLTEPLDSTSSITRLQLIDLYNIALEYQITREEYSKLGLMPLDALVPPAVKISKDGQSILEALSAIQPTADMQADHQIIVDCVQSQVAFAEELSSSIKGLNAIDMNKAGELVACDTFDASLAKITTFVEENK